MTKILKNRLFISFVIDLLLIGIFLCTFSLFHHVLPRKLGYFYGNTEPFQAVNFQEKFHEVFLSQGKVEDKEGFYRDDTLSLTVKTYAENGVTYHVADFYVSDVTKIKTAVAGGTFSTGVSDSTINMALENHALLAVSGDYFGIRQRGIVIRNGEVYRKEAAHDVCVLYYDGTMETYDYYDFDIDKAIARGAWQAWDFGPQLLDSSGKAFEEYQTGIAGENPRVGIGYFEPGHYVLIAVDGRQSHSRGMTLKEFALLFEKLGCKSAYNLDGGHSAVMTYKDSIYSSPSKVGGRDISDIIYLAPESYVKSLKENP